MSDIEYTQSEDTPVAIELHEDVVAQSTYNQTVSPGGSTGSYNSVVSTSDIVDTNIINSNIQGGSVTTESLAYGVQSFTNNVAFVVVDIDTVSWSAGGTGTIKLQDGTVYTIAAGNTGNMSALTYIYLDLGVSTTAFQTTTDYSNAVGDNKILIAVAKNGTTKASVIPYGGQKPQVTGDDIVAGTILAANIAAGTITANEISASYVYAGSIAANQITAGSGLIANLSVLSTLTMGSASTTGIIQSYGWNGTANGFQIVGGASPTVNLIGGTITGGIIQTSAATDVNRIKIVGANNNIQFWDETNTQVGSISCDYDSETGVDYVEMAAGECYCSLIAKGTTLQTAQLAISSDISNYVYFGIIYDGSDISTGRFTAGARATGTAFTPGFQFHVIPYGTATYDLGTSSIKWRNIYVSGTVDGVDISAHAADASAHHSSTSNGLSITPSSVTITGQYLYLHDSNNTIKADGTAITFNGTSNAHLCPASGLINSAQVGTSTNYWGKMYANTYYGKSTSISSFDRYDDLAYIKKMQTKIVDGKEIFDVDDLPPEVKDESGHFVDNSALTGYMLGCIKALAEKVDKLENK